MCAWVNSRLLNFDLYKILALCFSILNIIFQIPISDRPNRDGEGIFIRDDGKEMPKEILEETSEFLWAIHEDANKFAKVTQVEDAPKSIG